MKLLTSASLAVLVFGAGKVLANTSLEGQVFQGTLSSGCETAFTHILTFGADWKVIDNSPTWFGGEARVCIYALKWKGSDNSQLDYVVMACDGQGSHFKAIKEGDTFKLEGDAATLVRVS